MQSNLFFVQRLRDQQKEALESAFTALCGNGSENVIPASVSEIQAMILRKIDAQSAGIIELSQKSQQIENELQIAKVNRNEILAGDTKKPCEDPTTIDQCYAKMHVQGISAEGGMEV